jgi:hypothetical protein
MMRWKERYDMKIRSMNDVDVMNCNAKVHWKKLIMYIGECYGMP